MLSEQSNVKRQKNNKDVGVGGKKKSIKSFTAKWCVDGGGCVFLFETLKDEGKYKAPNVHHLHSWNK